MRVFAAASPAATSPRRLCGGDRGLDASGTNAEAMAASMSATALRASYVAVTSPAACWARSSVSATTSAIG
jgi:hypothetical protein